jgi:mono/diheme cytochrome c family protein
MMSRRDILMLILVPMLPLGCQQKMATPPSYRPLQSSALFVDGMSARPLPAGVVARQWLTHDDPLASGLKANLERLPSPRAETPSSGSEAPPQGAPTDPDRFVTDFPFELTAQDMERGQERYTIFCAVCHDPIGTGHGKIVERGYVRPPDYHTEASRGFSRYGKSIALRDVPAGYLFEVISRGYGAMPSYSPQIAPRDRWRVVAYVRALQLSQHAVLDDLPAAQRQAVRDTLGSTP